MTTTQHTPGPWKAEGWNNLVVNSRDGDTIIIEPGGSKYAKLEELQANALLIAAAPELLEALKGMMEWARRVKGYNPGPEPSIVHSVIRKATTGAEVQP
jgi:hypothetical protein